MLSLQQFTLRGVFELYRAHAAYQAGDEERAHQLFGAVAAQDNYNWRAFYNMGTIDLQAKRYGEAIKHFDKVLELCPNNVSARERRAIAEKKLKEAEQQKKEEQQKKSEQKKSEDDKEQSQKDEQSSQDQSSGEESAKSPAEQREKNEQEAQKKSQQNQSDATQNEGAANKREQQQKADKQDQQSVDRAAAQQKAEAERAEELRAGAEAANNARKSEEQKRLPQLNVVEQRLVKRAEEADRDAQRYMLQQASLEQQQKNKHKGRGAVHDW